MRIVHDAHNAALNVLMINTVQTGGGAGRAGESLADWLRSDGDTVTSLVGPDGAPGRNGSTGPEATERRVRHAAHWRTTRLANAFSRRGFTDIGELSSLAWRCLDEYPAADVIHLHNLHGDYASMLALPLWGRDKPLVWTLHDFWALTGNCATPTGCDRWQRACGRCPMSGTYPMHDIDRSGFYRRLKPMLITAAAPVLVTPSRWLAVAVRQHPQLRTLPLEVIPHAVDTKTFRPADDRAAVRRRFGLAPDAPTVVMVGNTWRNPLKGGPLAALALRRAATVIRDLQLLAIGQHSDNTLASARLPGVALPFVDDRHSLAAAYSCADVCLFPSLAENYPLTTLEAMAAGTPVCAFAVGGVPEQIASGETGLLAPAGDVDALARNLIELLKTPDFAARAGAAARTWVETNASPADTVARYRFAYQRAIDAWRCRRGKRSPRWTRGPLSIRVARVLGWEAAPSMRTPHERAASAPALAGSSAIAATVGGVS